LLSGAGATSDQLQEAYGRIPLSFEVNQGQTDSRVQYLARGEGYALFLTPTAAVFSLSKPAPTSNGHDQPAAAQPSVGTVLDMQLVGARPDAPASGLDEQASTVNYFIGSDRSRWRTNIGTYGQVKYTGVYAGIDLVYHGNQRQLEYDFDVVPGADPNDIRLTFPGATGIDLDAQGELVLHTAGGDVMHHAPVVYQEGPGGREAVAGRYVIQGNDRVGFVVGAYDPKRALIIDPTLAYSTYLGGSFHERGNGIAVDAAGNAYVTGVTQSTNFPTTPGAFQTTIAGLANAFVTKLDADGTALVYSTYLGGSAVDAGAAIAVDAAGNAFVTGFTESSNFPTTPGAFQTTIAGFKNAFVTKLNPDGTALVYSTYFGSIVDAGAAIAVDAAGNAYVSGDTESSNFPTTPGAFQTTLPGGDNAFVTKLNADGTALLYSTYLGGSAVDAGAAIAVDAAGNAYVTGVTESHDFPTTPGAFQTTIAGYGNAFVTKLNPEGTALVYSTYLGGSGGSFGGQYDGGSAIAIDAGGNAYITGVTFSRDFPTTLGAFQSRLGGNFGNAFVTKLSADGTALIYSTYLGGSASSGFGDGGRGIVVDGAGNAYLTGFTASSDFPTTSGAFQTTQPLRAFQAAFVTKLNADGTALIYSTYLGGSDSFLGDGGSAIAVDSTGNVYVTGSTDSSDFPTTHGAFQSTLGGNFGYAFVAKFRFFAPAPTRFFAVGGAPGHVLLYNPDGTLVADFAPYGASYTGPISVAVGDVNGDGIYDLVTGAAVGSGGVRVYDGQAFANGTFDPNNPDASLLAQFYPYGSFSVGVNVAVGDISGSGFADIVTGAASGNPDVRVFSGLDIADHTFVPNGSSLLAHWFAYGINFNVGANVAVGDVNGDSYPDIVTGATQGNPHVKVYNGKDVATGHFNPNGTSVLAAWFAYGVGFGMGVNVAVGDTTGDGFSDIITGATMGNPDVHVYSGHDIARGTFDPNGASLIDRFFAYDVGQDIGVTVGSADFEENGRFDIVTGSTREPRLRVVRGDSSGVLPPAILDITAPDLEGGIYVGA
jgi:hypothetical protein